MVIALHALLLMLEVLLIRSAYTQPTDEGCCTTEHYEMYLRSGDRMTRVDQHRCVMRPPNTLKRVAHCCCQATFVLETVGYGVEYYYIPEYGCFDVGCHNFFPI